MILLLAAAVLHFLLLTNCSGQFIVGDCGISKNCVFYPADCEKRNDCKKMVSFMPTGDGWTTIELFFNDTNANVNYASIGFSNDTEMGDDAVTHCSFNADGSADVHLSHNVGKSNVPIELENQDSLSDYVQLFQASRDDKHLYCKFRQKIAPDEFARSIHIPNLDRPYIILLAFGKTDNPKALSIHSLDANSVEFPTIFAVKTNLASAGIQQSTESNKPKKQSKRIFVLLHGMIMLLVWMWLIATAIASAFYLRNHWPQKKPCGIRIWFHIHRVFNFLAVLAMLISVLLIFIGKDWRWTGPAVGREPSQNLSAGAIHSIIGTLAVCLAVIQPFNALLRCGPETRRRQIFNWFHRLIGLTAFILAVIAIVIAVIFFHLWSTRIGAIILICVYMTLIVLTIALAQMIMVKRNEHTAVTYQAEERGGMRRGETINVITKDKDIYKMTSKLFLLFVVFTTFAAAISIAMIVLIIASMQ